MLTLAAAPIFVRFVVLWVGFIWLAVGLWVGVSQLWRRLVWPLLELVGWLLYGIFQYFTDPARRHDAADRSWIRAIDMKNHPEDYGRPG